MASTCYHTCIPPALPTIILKSNGIMPPPSALGLNGGGRGFFYSRLPHSSPSFQSSIIFESAICCYYPSSSAPPVAARLQRCQRHSYLLESFPATKRKHVFVIAVTNAAASKPRSPNSSIIWAVIPSNVIIPIRATSKNSGTPHQIIFTSLAIKGNSMPSTSGFTKRTICFTSLRPRFTLPNITFQSNCCYHK